VIGRCTAAGYRRGRRHRGAVRAIAGLGGSRVQYRRIDALDVHEPGDVYARDDFVYWGFSAEGLRRLARLAGFDEVEVVDEPEIDGHPRILAVLRAPG
jgi:hypothetical protein